MNRIYQYDPMTDAWTSFGNMLFSRCQHAVELVNYEDYSGYCST